jgi:hypothetical protein
MVVKCYQKGMFLMATDKIQTGLRLREDDLRKITYIARKKNRSLNAQIEYIIKKSIADYEKQNGEILPESDN